MALSMILAKVLLLIGFVFQPVFITLTFISTVFLIIDCGRKKKKRESSETTTEDEGDDDDDDDEQRCRRNRAAEKKKRKDRRTAKLAFHGAHGKPPKNMAALAKTNDPNYQTLAGLNNDIVFGNANGAAAEQAAPRAPPAGSNPGMVGTYDPNYQTLVGLNNAEIFKDKGVGGAPPRAPLVGGKAATNDPNYQEAGLNNNDIFKEKGPVPVENHKVPAGKVAANDPNYQTLAGLNSDIFKTRKIYVENKTNMHPKQPTQKNIKAATNDPNYQTLAGLNQDIFGADKKKK